MRQDTDSLPREFIRVLKDLELADPFDDEIREVLPSLAAAQRADPFFGPIFGYLEVALSDQAEAWLQAAMPADPLPGASARRNYQHGDGSRHSGSMLPGR